MPTYREAIADHCAHAREARVGIRADEIDNIAPQSLSGEIKPDLAETYAGHLRWTSADAGVRR